MDLGVVTSVLHEEPSPTSVTTSGANDYDNYICSAFCPIFLCTCICTPQSILSSPQGFSRRKRIRSCINLNLSTQTSIHLFVFQYHISHLIVYAAEILSSVCRAMGCLLAGMTAHTRFHANNRMQHDNGCNGVYVHAWANGLCVRVDMCL